MNNMSTEENLKTAFAGESQTHQRYLVFAEIAEKEGKKQIAKLFRAVAEAERVHAQNHLRAMGDISSVQDNLKTAIDGEIYEFEKMYPEFIKKAEEEKKEKALESFVQANSVEKTHYNLYKKALEKIMENQDLEENNIFVCQRCGNTVEGKAPDVCTVCGASKLMFKEID